MYEHQLPRLFRQGQLPLAEQPGASKYALEGMAGSSKHRDAHFERELRSCGASIGIDELSNTVQRLEVFPNPTTDEAPINILR